MVDVSNRTLAVLLVAAIVISLGGTIISLDRLGGMVSLTGQVTVDAADVPAPVEVIAVADDSGMEADEADESGDDADVSDEAMD